MAQLTLEQRSKGRQRFLDQNPEIARRISALTENEAGILGITLEHYREVETMKALSAYAHAHRLDSHELFLSCVADTADEFAQLKEASLQATQRAIGL